MKPAILAITTASLLMLPGCVSLGLGDESQDVGDGLGDALLTPIDDLNLRDREVPAALTAFDNAYQLNADYRIDGELDCDAIDGEIAKLSAVLGADPDALALAAQADEDDEDLGDQATSATLGLVSSTAGSIIPFRGFVRYASGASEADEAVIAAYLRGHQRRGFLRGVLSTSDCWAPRAPASDDAPANTTE